MTVHEIGSFILLFIGAILYLGFIRWIGNDSEKLTFLGLIALACLGIFLYFK